MELFSSKPWLDTQLDPKINHERRSMKLSHKLLQVGVKSLGICLTLIAIVFVSWQSWHYQIWKAFQVGEASVSYQIFFSSLLCMLSGSCLAFAWWFILISRSPVFQLKMVCCSIHMQTQIGKYLPGNVLHIAWRYALGKSVGLSHDTLIWGTLLELAFVVSGAIVIALPGASQWLQALTGWSPAGLGIAFCGILLVPLAIKWSLDKFQKIRSIDLEPSPSVSPSRMIKNLGLAFCCYLIYFSLNGWACWNFAGNYVDVNLKYFEVTILSIVSLAWIAGFITPGASAGIGIRETALILALSSFMDPDHATQVSLLYRIATLSGDIGTWLIGLLLQKHIQLTTRS